MIDIFICQLKVRLSSILGDSKTPLEVLAFTAITLGLVYVGSCCEEIAQSIIFALMDRSEAELSDPLVRFLPLALGLLYLGKQVMARAIYFNLAFLNITFIFFELSYLIYIFNFFCALILTGKCGSHF